MWVGKRGVRFGLPVNRPELRSLEISRPQSSLSASAILHSWRTRVRNAIGVELLSIGRERSSDSPKYSQDSWIAKRAGIHFRSSVSAYRSSLPTLWSRSGASLGSSPIQSLIHPVWGKPVRSITRSTFPPLIETLETLRVESRKYTN